MFQLTLPASRDRIEAAEDALLTLGALSVTLADAADHPLLEPLPGETPLWPDALVSGLFDDDADAGATAENLAAMLDIPAAAIRHEALPEREWTRAWMDGFRPMHFGGRLWIVPTGFAAPDPAAINLAFDPGLAFGTGTHPTTALCLEWLARHPPQDALVIDYGCGSGILAVAALALGAREVHAVDIDPQALTATRDNARRNGFAADRVHAGLPGDQPLPPADLLLANILSGPLVALAPRLAALLRPGGRIVLSGLLAGQAATVAEAYAADFAMTAPVLRDDWALLEGCRRG